MEVLSARGNHPKRRIRKHDGVKMIGVATMPAAINEFVEVAGYRVHFTPIRLRVMRVHNETLKTMWEFYSALVQWLDGKRWTSLKEISMSSRMSLVVALATALSLTTAAAAIRAIMTGVAQAVNMIMTMIISAVARIPARQL
ncbi:hypothetical protein [Methylocystis suflitae]|uniref:hypothetical protein n=1 Tax=Methylocystis suflitae TaxID=2951405 RepID=UPI00210D48E6|nr:hypothetical protein [Methylocystis suflitae]MCQ4190943.1 hypothetical protein [Methylocystis suflitae]